MPRVLAIVLMFVAGCDPAYFLHLDVEIEPAGVARVISLTHHTDAQWFDTDAAGRGHGRFGGFLDRRDHDPIAIYRTGRRLAVCVPGRDFTVVDRGWFFVTEWDAELHVDLELLPDESGVAAECGVTESQSFACSLVAAISSGDWCEPLLVAISPTYVDVTRLPGGAAAVGQGASRWTFALPRADANIEHFFVGVCRSNTARGQDVVQSTWVIVSDALPGGTT